MKIRAREHLRHRISTAASSPVRSVWRRCWYLTMRGVKAPCHPSQIPHLPRAVPQFGTKTSQEQVAREFWSNCMSSAQCSFESLFLNAHYLCFKLMPTMCTTLLVQQARGHLSRNTKSGIQTQQREPLF